MNNCETRRVDGVDTHTGVSQRGKLLQRETKLVQGVERVEHLRVQEGCREHAGQ